MNVIAFGADASERFGVLSAEPRTDKPLDAAWIVLEAANDLGDQATVEVCRRVIDASLNGTAAASSDLHIVTEYFR
ncbi:hypothetical protein SAMN05444158_3542 [Bradyrhizobium canariense]|uniref:Uncharacterized protein n=2 Tax=Bradyrhizobium canariense TaxID=255045 RepID=A0A1H1VV95_9BRAD|nr:hypothetical protein SAMN05444158_3542 [Bradyrhizobium canariense]